MTSPYEAFVENGKHVLELITLHAEKNKGKKTHHTHEILTKSSVVLFVACWEAFLEDTAEKAVDFLVAKTDSPKKLPKELLKVVSAEVRNNRNELMVWELAGNGWQDVLKNHYKAMLRKHLGPFNTPRAGNVDDLFHVVLGLERLSAIWYWKGMSNQSAKEMLSDIITLRGSIAHRVQASKKVTRALADRYAVHLIFLAIKTSNKVRRHVHSITGEYPWVEETYNSVK